MLLSRCLPFPDISVKYADHFSVKTDIPGDGRVRSVSLVLSDSNCKLKIGSIRSQIVLYNYISGNESLFRI